MLHCARWQALPITSSKKRRCRWAKKGARNWTIQQAEPAVLRARIATERGRIGYEKYRHDFSKLIWHLASPKWDFDDATFDRSAASFDNPDHVDIVIHNYR